MKALITTAVVAIVALFVYLYLKTSGTTSEGGDSGGGEDIAPEETGDGGFMAKIQELAKAIAFAEGFGKPGAVPTTFNNPGDLGPGDLGTSYPAEKKGGSYVSKLPSADVGWQPLYDKLTNIFNARSSVYNPGMTIREMGKKYAGDSESWSKNVASYLGITPDTTLAEWWSK